MTQFDLEERLMLLLAEAGGAKSRALEAVAAAKEARFDEAAALLKACDDALLRAHETQTDLIQASLRGEEIPVGLLAAHAEDHMMGAILAHDFALEIVELYRAVWELRKEAPA